MADRSGVLDAELYAWLQADFGLQAVEAHLVDAGADREATMWRVRDAAGQELAVKWTSGGTVAGLSITRALADAGIAGVLAPRPARDGRPWSDRSGRRLVVQPWVDAPGALGADLEERHWVAFGRLLAAVHAVPATACPHLPSSDRAHPRLRRAVADLHRGLTEALDRADTAEAADDVVASVLDEVPLLVDVVDALLAGADHLHVSGVWSGRGSANVVCHGDPHLGNVLADTDGGVWLLDWDDAVAGPREQDLLFVLDRGVLAFAPVTDAETDAFFAGYGAVAVDRHALAYHRSIRALEDLVDFANEVLAPDRHPLATREAACSYLRGNLVAGGLTEAALGSLHEVGALAALPTLRSPENRSDVS